MSALRELSEELACLSDALWELLGYRHATWKGAGGGWVTGMRVFDRVNRSAFGCQEEEEDEKKKKKKKKKTDNEQSLDK